MKVSKTILCAFIFAFGSVAALIEEPAPCDGTPDEEEPPETCLDNGAVCGDFAASSMECCDGLACTGFGFYKKCSEPPICLKKWYDCSDGTPCCEGMVCAYGSHGQMECQTRTITTRTVPITPDGEIVETSAPTQAPVKKNFNTTKVPGVPVELKAAVSSGDPHIRTFDGLKYDCQGEGEHILVQIRSL